MVYNLPMQSVELTRDTWRSIVREQGRSLAWLASRTGTPNPTVYSYSSGRRNPSDDWLKRAAYVLGVPLGKGHEAPTSPSSHRQPAVDAA